MEGRKVGEGSDRLHLVGEEDMGERESRTTRGTCADSAVFCS